MLNQIPNVKGFHVNDEEKSLSFLKDTILVVYEDTHYLGTGMYFWDNKSNAQYWVERKRSQGVKPIYISTCNIVLTAPLLDLTDSEVISRVERLWVKYCKKTGETRINQHLGTIIDVLYAVLPEIIGVMKVSKAHGYYNENRHKHNFLKDLDTLTWIDNSPKTIYCVRCPSRVLDVELLCIDRD